MTVFSLGLFVPEIQQVEQRRIQEQIVDAYRQWYAGYLEKHAFEPQNIRHEYDPEWRGRLFSIQNARDGNSWFWKATKVAVGIAQGAFFVL